MKILLFLSDTMIPLIIFYIIGTGLLQKKNVYEDFIEGAENGFHTVVKIMPTLVGLMVAVGILRASGLLDAISNILSMFLSKSRIPVEIIPVFIVRLFSNSAATGLMLDIFKRYGADSVNGYIVSIMMSSTETVFYTLSVYFMSVQIKKTRWTVAGALFSTLAGTAAAVWLGGLLS